MSMRTRLTLLVCGIGAVAAVLISAFIYRDLHSVVNKHLDDTAMELLSRSVEMFMVSTRRYHDSLTVAKTPEERSRITDDWSRSIEAVDRAVIHDFGKGKNRVRLIGDENLFGVKPLGRDTTKIEIPFETEAARELLSGKPMVRVVRDGYLRIAVPLYADHHPGCAECHGTPVKERKLLGTLNTYLPLDERTAQADTRSLSTVAIVVSALTAMVLTIVYLTTRLVVRPIHRISSSLRENASQFTLLSDQMAKASQSLAEKTSTQAAAIEETSSSLQEMTAMTRTNADNAQQADAMSGQARDVAGQGDKVLAQLNGVMTSIHESSDRISKIIRVIQEISFQTNLLALNAAVEAARAGEHGKGFAVVADEVRNLALRAAGAARETTELIQDAVNNAREGTRVAGEVATMLASISESTRRASILVNEISGASAQQAQGISQINSAVSQMDNITQQNAANAQETASAATILKQQCESMLETVEQMVMLSGIGAR